MVEKFFNSVDELTIKEVGIYHVNGWTIHVENKTSGQWSGYMEKDGTRKEFSNSITHIRKKVSAKAKGEKKEKGTNTKILGTTKKVVSHGVKLLSFDEMFDNACKEMESYKKAMEIVSYYESIFTIYHAPNNVLSLVEMMQSEQKRKVDAIRKNERIKKVFLSRLELAKKHLEKLEKEMIQFAMLGNLDMINATREKIMEQKKHVENMETQSKKF